jgi:hypothetical protein
VESFLRYRLSGTAHASVQNRCVNIWYKTQGTFEFLLGV